MATGPLQGSAQGYDLDISPKSGPPGTVVRVFQTQSCGVAPIAGAGTQDVFVNGRFVSTIDRGQFCPGISGFDLTDDTFVIPLDTAPGPALIEIDTCSVECGLQYSWTFTVVSPPTPPPTPPPPSPTTPAPTTPDPTTPPIEPTPPLTPTPPPPVDQCAEAKSMARTADPSGRNELAIVVVHGWRSDGEGMAPIVETLKSRHEGVLFVLDWRSKASANPFIGSGFFNKKGAIGPKTDNAIQVGRCLVQELDGFKRIHFIAHSLGSWVVDAAADELTPRGIETHLTFLDAYSPGLALGGQLGDRATFAEHFVSRPWHGIAPWTNHTLVEAHNYDVTDSRYDTYVPRVPLPWAAADALLYFAGEHGVPISWYANAGSPGIKASWEFDGQPLRREDGARTCLRGATPCVGPDPRPIKPADLTQERVQGSVARQNGGSLSAKTASPASATLLLPVGGNAVEVELVAALSGTGNGSIRMRLEGGEWIETTFGPDGFDGSGFLFLPPGTAARSLEFVLDASPGSQAELTLTAVYIRAPAPAAEMPTLAPSPGAPLPPSTGNTAPTGGGPGHWVVVSMLVLTVGLALVVGERLVRYRR